MHPILFLAVKESVGPQITKDRFSHVMAFPWSSDRRRQRTESGSHHNLRMLTPLTQYIIGSELYWVGAEHVRGCANKLSMLYMSHDEDWNQPTYADI